VVTAVRILVAVLVAGVVACAPTPPVRPGQYHASDADLAVTRLGHAGLLLDVAGHHFLVDPWLHDGFFVRQNESLGLHPDRFPAAGAVLLTGDDATRVDRTALEQLARTVPRAVAPPALATRLATRGFRDVVALGWWQEATIEDVRITAVPARGDGFVLRAGDVTLYVAGEGGDVATAAEIRRIVGPIDVALVPIGGRRTFGIRTATDPEQGAAMAAMLGARRVIPIAYGAVGTFPFVTFARDPVARFRAAAERAGVAPTAIVVLESGESWHYYRAASPSRLRSSAR
jgi:L-ascorbate metabolism protein UlaG (beta-lactamase superfamily)